MLRVAGASVHESGNGTAPRHRLEEQQWYIECLGEEIQMEQKRAERDLEREQACLRQQYTESEYRKHSELCLNAGFNAELHFCYKRVYCYFYSIQKG